MDLNYLYHRHGTSLMMAADAACERSRDTHLALARCYMERITALRGAQLRTAG